MFFGKINLERFPFVIEEKPLSPEGAKTKEDNIFVELQAVKEAVSGLNRELLNKTDRVEAKIAGLAVVIAGLNRESLKAETEKNNKEDDTANDLFVIMDELEACLTLAPRISEDRMRVELPNKIKLIQERLGRVLKKMDISRIKSVGKKFDSKMHVPAGIERKSGLPDYIITEEKSAGYIRKDKAVRQAEVIVAKNN